MGAVQFKIASLGLLALLLAGCSSHHASSGKSNHGFASAALDPFAGKGSPYYRGSKIPYGGGKYFVGKPYQVAGRWFTPHEQPGYEKSGMASWYGEAFHRRKTSNGEYFDMNTLTAAHATLPLPSYVLVTNLENNRNVIVRVNDRGPFVGTRVIDLSKRAADVLGYRAKGTAHVRVKLIGPAPSQDSMEHVVAMNDAMRQGAGMQQLIAMSGDLSADASPSQVAMNDSAAADAPTYDDAQMADASAPVARPRNLPFALASAQRPLEQVDYQPQVQAPQAFVVRVGVFHDLANAQNAYQAIESFGPAKIVRAVGANGPLYRVEMGPLDNAADAQAALTTAQGAGFEGAKLIAAEVMQISMR
jgi:rare lipoprotein A